MIMVHICMIWIQCYVMVNKPGATISIMYLYLCCMLHAACGPSYICFSFKHTNPQWWHIYIWITLIVSDSEWKCSSNVLPFAFWGVWKILKWKFCKTLRLVPERCRFKPNEKSDNTAARLKIATRVQIESKWGVYFILLEQKHPSVKALWPQKKTSWWSPTPSPN